MWWNPSQRLFYSILALIMSLAAWVTSNLGGFILGILLGLIGGSLAFAWNDPHKPKHGATTEVD
jgi:ABC-type arginine/histidine transport system permease subunit